MKSKNCVMGVMILMLLVASQSISAKSGANPNGPDVLNSGDRASVQVVGTGLTVDGGWSDFNWNTTTSTQINQNPFTFSFSGPVVLKVTDAYLDGDQFRVTVDGQVIGNTSVPTDSGASESDADLAFANPMFSSGAWTLDAGYHEITLEVIDTPACCTSGGAFIRVDTAPAPPKPIPTLSWRMMLLMVLGLGLLGVVTIRKLHN